MSEINKKKLSTFLFVVSLSLSLIILAFTIIGRMGVASKVVTTQYFLLVFSSVVYIYETRN